MNFVSVRLTLCVFVALPLTGGCYTSAIQLALRLTLSVLFTESLSIRLTTLVKTNITSAGDLE